MKCPEHSVCVYDQGLIFVVDSSDPERIETAAEELKLMVRHLYHQIYPSSRV